MSVYENLRHQTLINELTMVLGEKFGGRMVDKAITIGDTTVGRFDGCFDLGADYVEKAMVDFVFIDDNYILTANNDATLKQSFRVETPDGDGVELSFYGFFDDDLCEVIEDIFSRMHIIGIYSSLIFKIILAHVNMDNPHILAGEKYDCGVASINIEKLFPNNEILKAVSLFEDTIDGKPIVVLQYKPGNNLDVEKFEHIIGKYVDEFETMDTDVF